MGYNSGKYRGERQNYNNRTPEYIPIRLPEGYLAGGYYQDSDKQKLKKEYICDFAKDIAKILEKDGGREANKRTQIRKFYEYLLRVNQKMNMKNYDLSYIEADLAKLSPYVQYAGSRKVVSKVFVEFIEKNVAAIKGEEDLKAFVSHFESLIAYMKKD